MLSPTWLSPHGSWEESDVAAGGSGELPASGCPAGRRDCTQLSRAAGDSSVGFSEMEPEYGK